MNSADAIRIVGEAAEYGWNPQCLTCEIRHEDRPNLAAAVAKIEADARALKAVRVLDAWAATKRGNRWQLKNYSDDVAPAYWVVNAYDDEYESECEWAGPAPDAARIAAADALLANDPSLGEGL